jgi:hypothetical protein
MNAIDNFKKLQLRDIEKNELYKKNNIVLIRISYYIKFNDLQEFIIEKCKENNIIIKYKNKDAKLNEKNNTR